MKIKKRKIVKKISLKELRELILTETRRTLYEKLQKADTYVGCFYCDDVMPTEIGNHNQHYENLYISENSGNIGQYYVDSKKNRNKYDVWVYNDDNGYRPHVHIKGEKFETCVELEREQYFLHKPWHKPFPNSKVRDAFAIFIESPNKASSDFGNDTNYKVAVVGWNSNSNRPRVKVAKSKNGKIIIPNYRLLDTK